MPTNRKTTTATATPPTTDLAQFKELLLWCRTNGFALGDVSVGAVRATVMDVSGQTKALPTSDGPESMYERYGGEALVAAESEANELDEEEA